MAFDTSDRARIERAREVDNALASVRIARLEPSDDAKVLYQRYFEGQVTSEELERAFDLYLDSKYGPATRSGDRRRRSEPG
jgi:hypothetical protein